jgi:RNA-directed DNA polymerase
MLTFANVIWGARCGKPARRVLLGETDSRGYAYSVRCRRESASRRKAPHGLPPSRPVSTIPFDAWMEREHSLNPFARYADDAVAHCRSESEARALLAAIAGRLKVCKLEMHPGKSGVVYCKDDKRRKEYPRIQFTFLGYTFRPRRAKGKGRNGKLWTNFLPAVSAAATQRMCRTIREWHLPRQTSASLNELAKRYDATLRGWLNYYGRFYRSALGRVFDHLDRSLLRWALRKYRTLARSMRRARCWLRKMVNRHPRLFIHWLTFGRVTVRTMGAV